MPDIHIRLAAIEVVQGDTMKWHCIDCRQNFQGPTDRAPADGCAHCGSRNVFDCNIRPLNHLELRAVRLVQKN